MSCLSKLIQQSFYGFAVHRKLLSNLITSSTSLNLSYGYCPLLTSQFHGYPVMYWSICVRNVLYNSINKDVIIHLKRKSPIHTLQSSYRDLIHRWVSAEISYYKLTGFFRCHDLRVMMGLFQNGCHGHFILVIQFQYLHFMLHYGIKCTCCAFTNIFPYLSENRAQIERNCTCSFYEMELL